MTVDARARKALSKQLKTLAGSPGPGKYSECNDKGRKCHKVKPAIVLDIDETSLSNYEGLNAANFSAAGTVTGAVAGNDPVIAPTLALYEYARRKGVEAFFITGRPEAIEAAAQSQPRQRRLRRGLQPDHEAARRGHDDEYKSGERTGIEEDLGYTILVNVGDQDSDLAGGHARRAFKLPNPMYFIP